MFSDDVFQWEYVKDQSSARQPQQINYHGVRIQQCTSNFVWIGCVHYHINIYAFDGTSRSSWITHVDGDQTKETLLPAIVCIWATFGSIKFGTVLKLCDLLFLYLTWITVLMLNAGLLGNTCLPFTACGHWTDICQIPSICRAIGDLSSNLSLQWSLSTGALRLICVRQEFLLRHFTKEGSLK